MKNYEYQYYGYNNQDEYDYYNRGSIQESENIAAVCFAVCLVIALIAAVLGAGKVVWAFIHAAR